MKTIEFKTDQLLLQFALNEDNRLSLTYVGLINQKINRIKKNEVKFYHYVEAEVTGHTLNHHKGLKNLNTSFSESAKYLSHKVNEQNNYLEVIIESQNNELLITSHYLLYKSCAAISIFHEVKNISNELINLEHISTFFNLGMLNSNKPNNYIYFARNSWHREAQWEKHKLNDVGIFNGNNFTSLGSFNLTNNGCWSTKEYLPMCVLEDKNKHLATLYQIENNGSWNIEVGDFINKIYVNVSGPDFNHNFWMHALKPNEIFKSAKATISFAHDFEGVIQEITKARRLIRKDFIDNHELPVIFNDYMHALWDKQTTADILPLVDIAKEVNVDIFCIDAGWFYQGDKWWNVLGDWKEWDGNFPNGGLKGLVDYIHQKNMKAGLWIEIENVGINSPALKYLKDDYFFKLNNKRVVHNERYQLDFSNQEVYQYAISVIDRLMDLYHLDYLKIDYNIDGGIGTDVNGNAADGLLNHNRAFIRFLKEINHKYPNLTIENCASGGCRMDYEILKYAPIQSTSDQTDYLKYPYLAINVLTACPPEQAAVWSYPVDSKRKELPNDEQVIMNMTNAMFGRIHLASYLNKLIANQLDLVKEGISYFRSLNEFKKKAVPVFPNGLAKFFDKEVVGGLINDHTIILGVWNLTKKERTIKINLKKYSIDKISLDYPKSHNINYEYDKNMRILKINLSPCSARIFKLTLEQGEKL